MVICLERVADLHMAQLMPLPLTVSCFSKIQIGFTFLLPAHPGSPRQRAVKRVCVCYGIVTLTYMSLVLDGMQDYCQFETFEPRCWRSEVVVIKQAFYGRRRASRCMETEYEEFAQNPRYFGCSADVTAILHTRCSGKKQCEVRVFDPELANTKPCASGLMMFLEASYSCVEGWFSCLFTLPCIRPTKRLKCLELVKRYILHV